MVDAYYNALGLPVFPAVLEPIYKKVKKEYADQGTWFLEQAHIRQQQEQKNLYPHIMDALLREAGEIRKNPVLSEYALFVARAMENRHLFLEHLSLVQFPQQHPLMAFLCLIPAMEKTWQYLWDRGFPVDILQNTVGQYEDCVFLHQDRYNELGLHKRYFDHLQLYVDNQIVNIDPLRFEKIRFHDPIYVLKHRKKEEYVLLMAEGAMSQEGRYYDTPPAFEEPAFHAALHQTPEAWIGTPVTRAGLCTCEKHSFPKADYELILQPGDPCISVHIINKSLLSEERCQESYRRAKELFARYEPQWNFRAYHCHSWMLAPELGEILGPKSNILNFQKHYLPYPVMTDGEDVLNFVFKMQFTCFHDLPEETSLQRALKKRYLAGQRLYEYGGIYPLSANDGNK